MKPTSLCICLLTYLRTDYARMTINGILNNLIIPNGLDVRFHIADDGSQDGHVKYLVEFIRERLPGAEISVTNADRGGYGRNVNLASQVTNEYEFILMLEDDWELVRPLFLDDILSDMQSEPRIQSVRLGYLSHTQALRGEVITVGKHHRKYLLLDGDSPEPHVFAGHPRIETVAYQRAVGEWPENMEPGDTEFAVAHIAAARYGIVWPMDLVKPSGDLFCHIGTVRSY